MQDCLNKNAFVAQLAEPRITNARVVGSIPTESSEYLRMRY